MSGPPSDHEAAVKASYTPPGMPKPVVPVEWVRNTDGSLLSDHKNNPVSVARILATKPLKQDLCSRSGPGNRKLTYMSGEGVTRSLNDIFGYDGWNLDIKSTKREECVKDEKGRFHVAFTATVRLTHRQSGAYKEDCGAGDAIDRSVGTAIANALKASITDAMKRAARHFGDKLGNSLYDSSFTINKAPTSLKDALDRYDVERAKSKFGPSRNQGAGTRTQALAKGVGTSVSTAPNNGIPSQPPSKATTTPHGGQNQQKPTTQHVPPQIPKPVPQYQVPKPSLTVSYSHQQALLAHKAPPQPASMAAQTPRVSNNPAASLITPAANQSQIPTAVKPTQAPPPTPNQGLQASQLFAQPALSNGSKGTSPPNANENLPPTSDFDPFDVPRPMTATGSRKSFDMAPPMAGTGPLAHSKRPAPNNGTQTQESTVPNKKQKNPYTN